MSEDILKFKNILNVLKNNCNYNLDNLDCLSNDEIDLFLCGFLDIIEVLENKSNMLLEKTDN